MSPGAFNFSRSPQTSEGSLYYQQSLIPVSWMRGPWTSTTATTHQLKVLRTPAPRPSHYPEGTLNSLKLGWVSNNQKRQLRQISEWAIEPKALTYVMQVTPLAMPLTGKNTCFHQHVWCKSAFAPKILVHIWCKWMTKRSGKWSSKPKRWEN